MAEVPSAIRLDALLAAALPPGALFAVGGRVRDEIRTQLDGTPAPVKDFDYVVTGLELDDLVERLRSLGRADVVGAAFAVVKATVAGTSVDIALPRRERSTGTGHRDFAVEWGPAIPLEDDLARRDFRMNMIARAIPSGRLVDPYLGERDIRAKRIDILRAAAFDEDPLRMLRACQFAARFDYAVAPHTLEAMRAAAGLATTISPERTRDELVKLIELAARPSVGFEIMRETGLLSVVLPELAEGIGVSQNAFHAYDVYRHNLATMDAVPPGNLSLRLAALLHDVGKPRTKSVDPEDPSGAHFYRHEIVGETLAESILTRLRFAGTTVSEVARLVRHHMYVADPDLEARALRRFIRRVGPESLELQFDLRAADIVGSGLPKRGEANERFQARVWELLAERPALSVRDLAVSGDDVVAALVQAGRLPAGSRGSRDVGVVLSRLLERVIDEPSRNVRDPLLVEVAAMVVDL